MYEQKACLHHKFKTLFRHVYEVHLAWLSLVGSVRIMCVSTLGRRMSVSLTSSTKRYHSFSFICKWERLHCELIYLLIEQIWQHRVLKHDKWNCDHVCSFVYSATGSSIINYSLPRGAFSLLRAPLGNILFHKQPWVSHPAFLEALGFCEAEAL